MEKTNIVGQYFWAYERKSKCKKNDQIMGLKYSLSNKDEKGKILRYILDNHLDASISHIRSEETYQFEYIDESDLIIIGFCLSGKQIVDYKSEHILTKGEIIYFRPTESFNLKMSDHSFLYYYIDCNSFKKCLECRNCDDLFCDFHIDYICNKGEIIIEKAPDIIMAHIDEMKKIKRSKTNNFLDYAKIKGQLLNYLTWFIGLRLNENPHVDEGQCEQHYVSKAKKIILDHLEEQITVKKIAQQLDISTYKLQKCFKQFENTTVYDYIRRAKIDQSKIFLKESSCAIIDIAQQIGYENPSKFSTTFKSITGYTPTEYRNL